MDSRPLQAARPVRLLDWLAAALCVLTLAAFSHLWWKLLGFFWDISVYERAATDYSHGIDAYRRGLRFPFVYHPLILRVLAQLQALISLEVLLPVLTLAATAWLFIELVHGKRLDPTRVGLGFLTAAGFGGIGAPALMSGNLSPLMHLALMAALLRSTRAAGTFLRYLPYGLIFSFALVKPYMLIYLVVPLLYERRVIALACSALVLALFALTWLSFMAHWPGEYASFVANLSSYALGNGDLGYSFFYVFLSLTRKLQLALTLHAVASLLLIGLVPLLFAQKYGRQAPAVPQLMLMYLVLTIANPRMKDYDLFPALIGFFTVFGLVSSRASYITLAGLLLASIPVIVQFVVPEVTNRHPQILDPFGNWQLIGLALIAIAFLVEMNDAQRAVPAATRPCEPGADKPPAPTETQSTADSMR